MSFNWVADAFEIKFRSVFSKDNVHQFLINLLPLSFF